MSTGAAGLPGFDVGLAAGDEIAVGNGFFVGPDSAGIAQSVLREGQEVTQHPMMVAPLLRAASRADT